MCAHVEVASSVSGAWWCCMWAGHVCIFCMRAYLFDHCYHGWVSARALSDFPCLVLIGTSEVDVGRCINGGRFE